MSHSFKKFCEWDWSGSNSNWTGLDWTGLCEEQTKKKAPSLKKMDYLKQLSITFFWLLLRFPQRIIWSKEKISLETLYQPRFISKFERISFYVIYVLVILFAWLPCLIFDSLPPAKRIIERLKKAEIRLVGFQNNDDEQRATFLRREFFTSFDSNVKFLDIILIVLAAVFTVKCAPLHHVFHSLQFFANGTQGIQTNL